MAKRQTRRSISVKGITYQRLKTYCDSKGKSVSGFLEEIIADRLDAVNAPIPIRLPVAAPLKVSKPVEAPKTPEVPKPTKVAVPPKPRSGPTDFSQEFEESFGRLRGPKETTSRVLGESRKTGDHDPWE